MERMVLNKLIVGLTGPAGCGKSTAAFHLEELGFKRIRFAGALKSMMMALGLSQEHIEGSLKEVPCALLGGKTPRYAMQTLGTEWGRNLMGENLWTDIWQSQVNSWQGPVVVDDCRFPNEEKHLRAMGGKIIRIIRNVDTTTPTFTHESEKHVITADYTIINDGSIDRLYEHLDFILDGASV